MEQDGGNYTCKCGNQFGETDFSQPSELVFMSGTPPGESGERLLERERDYCMTLDWYNEVFLKWSKNSVNSANSRV